MAEIKVYAHRGASGYALENTWNAFHKACEFGVGIELDVQITKDGVVVVYHDENLKRLSGKNLLINEVDYEYIKELRIGKKWFRKVRTHKVPLAYEVFQWAKKNNVPLNVEMKKTFAFDPNGPKILAAMLENAENIHLSSFDPELLKEMKKLLPATETALIIKKKFVLEKVRKMYWVDSVHLHKKLHSKKMLESLASIKKNIRIYGMLGSEKLMSRLDDQLIGIITDYPDIVKEKLRLPENR